LEEIRAAIVLEKKSLEDLCSLSANTDSLATMLLVQKEKKETFEKTIKEKEDAFNAEIAEKKVQFEQEVSNREQALKNAEAELAELRKSNADIRLKDQIIASLQGKIKEQQAQLKENMDKANRAEANVKDIAVKAIENSSKVRMFTAKPEKEDN
jgi:chromosome segregation ATPase